MKNMTGKILIACEESQVVTKAFRDLGFEAYSCDLQNCSGGHPEWHIQGDAISEAHSGKYDLMIAHPPCTFMSNAGACRMYPTKGNIDNDRLAKAMKAKEFFMKMLNAPIKHIAIENPLPLSIVGLPTANQVIQPYQFGDPFSKKTLLWLKNLPILNHTNVLSEWKPFIASGTSRNAGKTKGEKFAHGSKQRSKTFDGIAKAMAEQWSLVLTKAQPIGSAVGG
jgi:hypothetical protein